MEKPKEVDAERKHSPSFWGFFLWPAVVLMLYVLSVGPVRKVLDRPAATQLEWTLARAFYIPLVWVHDNVPPFGTAVEVYLGWWGLHW